MTDCDGKPQEPLNATSNAVYEFVRTLYHEVAGLLGTNSSSNNNNNAWIHIGGDEVPLNCWEGSSQIHQWMREHGMQNVSQLLGYFEAKLLHIATNELGFRAVVWQELFDDLEKRQQRQSPPLSGRNKEEGWSPLSALPKQTVVDVWKLSDLDTIQKAAAVGHDVIVSACWYLDHLNKDWEAFYECDPRKSLVTNLTRSEKRRVVGGHASMWGERVDTTNFMSRVWPRASAGTCLYLL